MKTEKEIIGIYAKAKTLSLSETAQANEITRAWFAGKLDTLEEILEIK